MSDVVTLYRPVGSRELKLIEETGYRGFPPRLPEQPIFYPVTNQAYARQIARDWNTKHNADRRGYVTRFDVRADFLASYERRVVGGREHEEYWIPAEDLEAFNDAIHGSIEVIEWYGGEQTLRAIEHVQLAMPAGEEDRARAFYHGVLGLPEQPKPPELAKRGGAWFENAAVKVHLGVETPFTPARKAHVAFVVDRVSDLAARARSAGYEVKDDADLPGFERAFIYDPFGNRLEFMTPLEGTR